MKKVSLVLIMTIVTVLLTACGCHHENTSLVGRQQATCQNEGYSGDVFCNDCKTTIEQGKVLPKTEHTPSSERSGDRDATCTEDGYTGNIICTACGEILEKGEIIPATGHTPENEYRHIKEATCTKDGYSGDLYCSICNNRIEEGHTIPAMGHSYSNPEGAYAATCLLNGYSGDFTCTKCGYIEKGRTTPLAEHTFNGNICTSCGWMRPGFYKNGEMVMSWQELKDNNFVTIEEDGRLNPIKANLAGGTLVIGEDVKKLSTGSSLGGKYSLEGINADEIWIPRSITDLGHYIMFGNQTVKTLVIYARDSCYDNETIIESCNVENVVIKYPVTYIEGYNGWYDDYGTFGALLNIELPEGLIQLEDGALCRYRGQEIILPSTLQILGNNVFRESALRSIDLPNNLIEIGESCFQDSNLENIVLPEGLEEIGANAFSGTNIQSVILPSSITSIGKNAFSNCHNLTYIDFSACKRKTFQTNIIENCPQIRNIRIPDGVETVWDIFNGCSIQRIVFPDSVCSWQGDIYHSMISSDYYIGTPSPVEEIVWPVKLTDVEPKMIPVLTSLKRICYRGTETQWQLNPVSLMFDSNVTVVYNWEEPNDL